MRRRTFESETLYRGGLPHIHRPTSSHAKRKELYRFLKDVLSCSVLFEDDSKCGDSAAFRPPEPTTVQLESSTIRLKIISRTSSGNMWTGAHGTYSGRSAV